MLFCNISVATHSNNISEILILFEYFRNMYPCHRRLIISVKIPEAYVLSHLLLFCLIKIN